MNGKKSTAKPKRRRIQFCVQAEPGSVVSVAGSFNDWGETAKVLKDKLGNGQFTGCLLLEPGAYEYKLLINGQWTLDPKCENIQDNSLGTKNNVLKVDTLP